MYLEHNAVQSKSRVFSVDSVLFDAVNLLSKIKGHSEAGIRALEINGGDEIDDFGDDIINYL
tara:strand:+ start:236 stop:421 length:186 start_codon:yes stop_codon:yes gene_type:complete